MDTQNKPTKQFAVRYPGGHISTMRDEEFARAAVNRLQGWVTTKGATLLVRDVQVTEWRAADGRP